MLEALKKILEILKVKTTATNESGELSELHLSQPFIHKVSIMVLCYLVGLATALSPVFDYFEISRPALINEVEAKDKETKKELNILEIQLLVTKVNTYEIELSLRNKELAENRLSIKYVDENVTSVNEKQRLREAYSKEAVLLQKMIEKLEHEIHEANKRIDILKAK